KPPAGSPPPRLTRPVASAAVIGAVPRCSRVIGPGGATRGDLVSGSFVAAILAAPHSSGGMLRLLAPACRQAPPVLDPPLRPPEPRPVSPHSGARDARREAR